jgi:hypothetical protein
VGAQVGDAALGEAAHVMPPGARQQAGDQAAAQAGGTEEAQARSSLRSGEGSCEGKLMMCISKSNRPGPAPIE